MRFLHPISKIMIIGVPKETFPDERRVALIQQNIPNLTKTGFEVLVESKAGGGSGFSDSEYTDKGAKITGNRKELFSKAGVILQVRGFGTNPKSPIAGMPILDVDKARTVIVIKRSLSPGFAGIPNPLFAMDNTLMLFGDGKKMILDFITAVKEA